ncbi:NAD-dependent epimerase/dehydratase family protein [Thermobifida halotolerans]|uniref:NAD-dependent epimerase/dehydratase family protein n=1 Tax=Thermobifida halotolerans TaxID=483545 RepID=A0A399G9P3_9ACTN|nr:NAD-dependent epimerase/dehydratase family protein [Thermobifida halotolerans]UOE21144.1 NAD-dependent epimerase/dehydratase family protein [Thermobifida halotolerans]
MLVAVTGGTGFVGAHSVAEIVRAGHRVRLLVRSPDGVDRALDPLGVDRDAVEAVVGDATDGAAVASALRGADAVLHAASVYSFDSRRRAEIRRTNERSTRVVLEAARRAGADPIVHVSTFGALLPARGGVIGPDSPVGSPRETYLASKAAAERVARRHQREGAPVVITYPPALLGPHSPRLGDQAARVRDVLRGLMPVWPLGGFPVGDVRDTARLHAALLTAPRHGRNRHFGPGRLLSTPQYLRVLREVTGRALPALFLPARLMLPVGRCADLLQRVWPWHIPAEYGAVYTCARAAWPEGAVGTHGIGARPVAETLADTVRWLYDEGHLTARQAGVRRSETRGTR